jgi:hypothetical protein
MLMCVNITLSPRAGPALQKPFVHERASVAQPHSVR